MYGLTEAGPWVAVQRVSDILAVGQLGQLLPGIQGRLITDSGVDAPSGGPGELWIKGPNVAEGYIDNPEANKNAFPENGWFNTGDICTISTDGIVSLTGRTKELIKYNSFQVSPNELEVYIGRHPAVRDCAVGPTRDTAKDTELPTAYIVLNGDFSDNALKLQALKDIHEQVNRQVSGYKRLRGGVWEVTQIPRNATSKVLRKDLRMFTTGLCSIPKADSKARL
jgi:acyl-CoA synthetase (AMP-forming)/AMP-acid ligase II